MRHFFGITIILIASLGIITNSCGPSQVPSQQGKKSLPDSLGSKTYASKWEKVGSYQEEGKPKSAQRVAEKILRKARNMQNPVQQIKATNKIHELRALYAEDAILKNIKGLRNQLNDSYFPAKPLLQSLLARQFQNFYRVNSFSIRNRTATTNSPGRIKEWSPENFYDSVSHYFEASLEPAEELKNIHVASCKGVIEGDTTYRSLRPYLFDLLAHRALSFYNQSQLAQNYSPDQYIMQDSSFFGKAEEFHEKSLAGNPQKAPKFKALKIYQKLLTIHASDSAYNPLIHADLERLNFVYDNANQIKGKKGHYYQALQQVIQQYPDKTAKADAYYYQAQLAQKGFKPASFPDLPPKQIALQICKQPQEKFPGSIGAENCKALSEQIQAKSFSIEIAQTYLPREPAKFLLNYRNLDSIYYRIIPLSQNKYRQLKDERGNSLLSQLKDQSSLFEIKKDLELPIDYRQHQTEPGIPGLEVGPYAILISNNPSYHPKDDLLRAQFFQVSQLSLIKADHASSAGEFLVLNAKTGQPEENVQVNIQVKRQKQENRYKTIGQLETNEKGRFQLRKQSDRIYFQLHKDNDTFFTNRSLYIDKPRNRDRKHKQAHIFTDRSIYRPGQTVNFKGIAIETANNGKEQKILTNQQVKVQLVDANNQTVQTHEFRTNSFGSFSGKFSLPSAGLTGFYRLRTPFGTQTISVEEYKRPNFEIKLPEIKAAYQLNEEVKLKGEAVSYSGTALEGAKVQYKITRQPRFPFWYGWGNLPSTTKTLITQGKTSTDDNGNFQINFQTQPDPSVKARFKPVFRYRATVTVTDLTGETHQAQKTLKASYQSLFPNIKTPDWVDQAKGLQLTPYVRNINGDTISQKGRLTVSRLEAPDNLYRNQLWGKPDLHLEDRKAYKTKYPFDPYQHEDEPKNWDEAKKLIDQPVKANQPFQKEKDQLETFEPGYYQTTFKFETGQGDTTRARQIFKVYQKEAKKAAVPAFSYLIPLNTKGEPGEEASFIWGSADEKAYAKLHIEQNGEVIDKRELEVNNGQQKITIPIKEEYRGNIQLHVLSVNENRINTHQETIRVPWRNKQLEMELTTFRNKLKPGEKDKWTITLKEPDGTPADAELLASMYDASLDAIKPHNWSFNLFPTFRPSLRYETPGVFSSIYGSYLSRLGPSSQQAQFQSRDFEKLLDPGISSGFRRFPQSKQLAMKTTDGESQQAKKDEAKSEEEASDEESQQQLRKDLRETAFFLPQIRTNDEGVAEITFETPEALTRWKAMFLAHDQSLANVKGTRTLVTQKKLMVEPNVPRFLREGDKIHFSAKVSNLSEKTIEGPITLTIRDAENREKLNTVIKENPKQSFNLKPGSSTAIEWKLEAPDGKKGLIYQIKASANNHTDGQEGLIPILPNKKLVTESLPLWVHDSMPKAFNFSRMMEEQSASLENHRVVLEMATNPSWYAIQALPSLMKPDYDCSEQVFNAFFSNSLAHHILKSDPEIKQVFDQWEKDSTALQAELEKDQGLKSSDLEQTPWLEEAEDESQRKAKLARYFKKERVADYSRENLRKLKKWQLANGAWPWFKGMNASRSITQTIIGGIGHMKNLDIQKGKKLANASIVNNALDFMDRSVKEDWQKIQKRVDSPAKNHLGAIQVQYLYARSFYQNNDIADKEAFDYWLKQAKNHWLSRSIMEQGMLALALDRYGHSKTAKSILASLKDKALEKDGLGMYWRDNQSGYQWYRSPIEAQAILIEAFSSINGDTESVEAMKAWLLKQKQVQSWPTTKATAKACYALLLEGKDWLTADKTISINLNGKKLDITENKQAGTGYFRKTWDGEEAIDPQRFQNIKIQQSGEGIAWGALHWQYFERLDRISSYETPLKIDKTLYKKVTQESGTVLQPLAKGDSLDPGDYVTVRLNIQTDRTMDFVHLKDMRAPALEPLKQISGYQYQGGLGYYQSIRDASANFFFDRLRKGSYTLEYQLVVSQKGSFQNGIGTIQNMYAPEFNSHSGGRLLEIK